LFFFCLHTLPSEYDLALAWTMLPTTRALESKICTSRTDTVVFPYTCLQRKTWFLSNSEERPSMLPWHPDGCNLELFEASWHWWASGQYWHIVQTDVADWWVSGRFTGPSGRKQRIRFFWVGIYSESFLNTKIAFLLLVTLELSKNFEDFRIYAIPVKTTTLHDSDFVHWMHPIKN